MTNSLAAYWFDHPVNGRRPAFRLYCFPYAGATSAVFRSWATALLAYIEIVGMELPGRGGRVREPLLSDLDTLSLEAADAVAETGDTRFGFFGHSKRRSLRLRLRAGCARGGAPAPRHLFASGCRAPHWHSNLKPVTKMSDEEFIATLRDLNGTLDSVPGNPELMGLVLPVLKSDFTAVDRWQFRPERALNLPMTAMGGRSDPHVSVAAVHDWRDHTRHEFQYRFFPGDHFFIHSNEQALLDFIIRTLRVEACV